MRWHVALACAMTAALPGCQKYVAQPLRPAETLARIERERHELPDQPSSPVPFTFGRVLALMAAHSPALKEDEAQYRTALATAKIKTPFPNPELEAGPMFSFGPDVGNVYRTAPFGSLSFRIPTGNRLKRQDELNRLNAEMARIEFHAHHRELYLEARKLYSGFVLGRARISARNTIAESAEKSTSITRSALEAGISTTLDLGLIELEASRFRSELLMAESAIVKREGELSEIIGVSSEHFSPLPENALPRLPPRIPELKALHELLLANHPGLARARARYEVAERELHLEIAKQYPDFKIGAPFDHETGEKKMSLGLSLGIELPIFDRNQQAVGTALKRREEVRIKYEAAANRALAALDRAWKEFQISAERLKLLQTTIVPKANRNIELARKSLQAGTTDALRFLETERAQRAVLIESVDAELEVREAWIAIEQAVGARLLQFPGETSEFPPLEAPEEPKR